MVSRIDLRYYLVRQHWSARACLCWGAAGLFCLLCRCGPDTGGRLQVASCTPGNGLVFPAPSVAERSRDEDRAGQPWVCHYPNCGFGKAVSWRYAYSKMAWRAVGIMGVKRTDLIPQTVTYFDKTEITLDDPETARKPCTVVLGDDTRMPDKKMRATPKNWWLHTLEMAVQRTMFSRATPRNRVKPSLQAKEPLGALRKSACSELMRIYLRSLYCSISDRPPYNREGLAC